MLCLYVCFAHKNVEVKWSVINASLYDVSIWCGDLSVCLSICVYVCSSKPITKQSSPHCKAGTSYLAPNMEHTDSPTSGEGAENGGRKIENIIQYSALSPRLSACTQAVYFLHLTRPSVTWLNIRWWLAAYDWVMSALSAVLSTRVGRRGKFGDVSWRECTGQGNDFELIATVKIKTRNSEDGYFGSDL